MNILRTNENGVFLSYYLNNIKKEIAKFTQGISIMHLYSSELKNVKIKIPSKKEQKKISDFLLKINYKIELIWKRSIKFY
ncbi:restriction endonuclease subunit S [Methanobrevibacter sp. 87.7]|uniref:restriction endonuclease subunit S n=1 Tax=Methanobrevibacter sp. 87.7 TaxID=387957 RepID=UPI000B4FDD7E